jgi:hypothetical protein
MRVCGIKVRGPGIARRRVKCELSEMYRYGSLEDRNMDDSMNTTVNPA